MCVCFFSVWKELKEIHAAFGPAKIAQTCPVGVSNLFQNAKVFRFHETILSFGEPGSLEKGGWETTFFVGCFFLPIFKTYMGFRMGMGTPTFPPQKMDSTSVVPSKFFSPAKC